jgi:hypothetical protein
LFFIYLANNLNCCVNHTPVTRIDETNKYRISVWMYVLTKMLQNVFVIFLALSQGCQGLRDNFGNVKEDKCKTHSFTIYEKHFQLVNFLTITILQTDKYREEMNELVENFFKSLQTTESLDLSCIKIEETFSVDAKENRKVRSYYKSPKTDETGDGVFHVNSNEDVVKIKKDTTDSGEGRLIIVSSPDILEDFLDRFGTVVVPKPRATYAFLFAFSSTDCEVLAKEMHHILRQLWTDYNILDAIALAPCSCASDQIYIYRPFVKVNNFWGASQSYNTREIENDPSLVANALRNLNRFPLRVAIFENNPSAIKVLPRLLQTNEIYANLSSSRGYAGTDGLILGTIVEYLNVDAIVDDNMGPFNYGHEYPDGTVTEFCP